MDHNLQYSEAKIVRKLKQGDKKAFEIIFNKYKEKLYFYAFGFLHSKSETEEIVQNVFVSLWEHRSYMDDSLSIKNYLYKATVNKIYNHLKHAAIHQKYMEYKTAFSSHIDENTQKTIFHNNLEETVESLVSRLPEKQQLIFRMSRFEGIANIDIAKKLKISIRSVENQVYRALKYIKENLKEEYTF